MSTQRITNADILAAIQGFSARLDVIEARVGLVAEVKADAPANEPTFRERVTARKESNAQMSTWLRSKGLPIGGAVWEAAKQGERNVRTLRRLAAQDKAARKAA